MTRGSLSITQETLNRSREAESCFDGGHLRLTASAAGLYLTEL